MNNEYELKPIYDTRKSFYKKAYVMETTKDNMIINKQLLSYGTLVAEIKNGKPLYHGFYSNTTTRHQKEFFRQNGFDIKTRKDMDQYLVIE